MSGTQRIVTPTKVLVELVVSFATGLFNFVNKDFQIHRQTTSFYFTKPPRPTQPPTLSGTGNEYRPNCGDTVWEVKAG